MTGPGKFDLTAAEFDAITLGLLTAMHTSDTDLATRYMNDTFAGMTVEDMPSAFRAGGQIIARLGLIIDEMRRHEVFGPFVTEMIDRSLKGRDES